MSLFRVLSTLAATTLLALSASAATWSAKQEAAPAPTEVSDAIKALLSDQAVVIASDDKPELTLWPVKEVPLTAAPESPAKALEKVGEASLLGVVQVHVDRRDYRDDEMPAGIYTVRMGLRPNDGDHLGTSDYVFFGVLIPASKDKTVNGYADHDKLSEASAEETAVFHPSILSFRPDSKPEAAALSLVELPEEHKAIRIPLNAKAADAAHPLALELVVEGKARH